MDDLFKELKDSEDLLKAYDVYKYCMYMPTKEKYELKVKQWLQDENIKVHVYLEGENIRGVIAILLQTGQKAEILGISVDTCFRGRGIGSQMIQWVKSKYCIEKMYAETDDEAVSFYDKSGFKIKEHIETYGDQSVIRYNCVLGS